MPSLADLLTPASTAVLTVEMQRGVIGDQVRPGMTALPEAASRAGTVAAAARVARAARAAGVRVVHATISLRADRAGVSINNRMMAVLSRDPEQMREGTPAVEIIPELEVSARDIVMNRVHGLTPFGGTELDAVLRNLGVRTIVPVGGARVVAGRERPHRPPQALGQAHAAEAGQDHAATTSSAVVRVASSASVLLMTSAA